MKRVAVLVGIAVAVMSAPLYIAQGSNTPSGDSALAQSLTVQLGGLLNARKLQGTGAVPDAELSALIARRKQAMLELARTNPSAFLASVLPEEKRQLVPQSLQSNVEQSGSLEGTLEVFHSDDFEHPENSRFYYFLNATGGSPSGRVALKSTIPKTERIELYPVGGFSAISGTKVRFKSAYRLQNVGVANTSSDNVDIIETPKLDSVGEQKTLVLLFQYKDSPNPPFTKEEVKKIIFEGQFQKFYKEQSYDQVSFSGDVYGWFTLDGEAMDICQSNNFFIAEETINDTLKKLIADNVDVVKYRRIISLYNHPEFLRGCALIGKVDRVINGKHLTFSEAFIGRISPLAANPVRPFSWSALEDTLSHEMGHNLGLPHANFWHCGNETLSGKCFEIEYGNFFDIMGARTSALHLNAYYKKLLNWLPPHRVLTISKSGRYTINTLETSSGTVLAEIPHPISHTPYIALEYRQGIGFDQGLSSPGLLGNLIVKKGSSFTADLLAFNPNSWPDAAAFSLYRTFIDPETGITIGPILSADEAGVTFDVKLGELTCIRRPLQIDFPQNLVRKAGTAGSFSLGIMSKDSLGCSRSPVEFYTTGLPRDWTMEYFLEDSPVRTHPGIKGNENLEGTMRMNIPLSTSLGKYEGKLEITRSGEEKQQVPFSVVVEAPIIISALKPPKAPVGEKVTIQGTGLPQSRNGSPSMYITLATLDFSARKGLFLASEDGMSAEFTVPDFLCRNFTDCKVPVRPGPYTIEVLDGNPLRTPFVVIDKKPISETTRSEISKTTGKEKVTSGPLQTTKTPVTQSMIDALRARVEGLRKQRDVLRDAVRRTRQQPGTTIIPSKPHLPTAPMKKQLGDISTALQNVLEAMQGVIR